MKKILLFFSLCILWRFSSAQKNPYPEVTISSPTAAALGKYGDIPVSYHTGVPDIGVPIYTVTEGSLKLPISLSYHASGIKLMEPASWVGLGWSLNAGGVITRTVQGAPDEAGTGSNSNQTYGHFSDYGYNSYMYAGTGNVQDWQRFASGDKDGQPDMFFFNFGGYSGKFYFSDDRTPVIVPQQDFKIDYTYTYGASIQSFTITTPDGVKYFFGNSPGITGTAPFESTNPWNIQNGLTSGTVISSWFLNKIQSADGLFSISLQYVPENYGYFTIGSHPVDPVNVSNNDYRGYYLTKNIMHGVRLSKITCSNGEVDFIANTVRADLSDNSMFTTESTNSGTTSAKALDKIQINDNSGFCKSFNFSYDYFTDANNTPLPSEFSTLYSSVQTDTKRLKLTSVQESSCDGSLSVNPYVFTYSTQNLPRRLCFAQDYWGYNNGNTSNQILIPTYTTTYYGVNTQHSGADRSTAWPAMEAGTLKQITYPTKGSTSFDYEPNDVWQQYTTSDYSGHFPFYLNLPGAEDVYSQSDPITVTEITHPLQISINNTSNYSATFQIFNSSGSLLQSYTLGNNSTDNENYYFPSTGNYTCKLSILSTSATGGCQAYINYNWATTTHSQNSYVGGLRIKTITQNTNITNTNNIVTNYSYYNNGNSTGVLYDIPAFAQIVRNDMIENIGYYTSTVGFNPNTLSPNGCIAAPSPEYYISAGDLRPMTTVQGSIVGYKQVTVSQTGNGSSVYHYYVSDFDNFNQQSSPQLAITSIDISGCDPQAPNFPAAPLPFDSKRGELYYEEHFDNSGTKLKDVFYYPVFNTNAGPVTPVFTVGSLNTALLGTFSSMSNVRKVSVNTVETDYSPQGNITINNTKYFGSNYHNEVTKEQSTDSKGNTVENDYKYAFDFRVTSCDASNCLTNYTNACTSCTNTYNTARQACNVNDATCLTNAYMAMLQCNTNARVNYVGCQQTTKTSAANCYSSARSSADTNLNPILEMQNQYINAPVETSNWRSSQLVSASFNKYMKNSAGAIYLHYPQKLNLSAPSSSFTDAAVNSNGLTKDSRYTTEATINYNSGNIHDIAPKAGVPTSYIWDYGNNLPVAKVANVASTDIIAYTSFESDGTGGWTIGSTQRYKNAAATGSQSYNLSSGTITKSITPSVKYKITFWAKKVPTISGATQTFTGKKNFEQFTYYEYVTKNDASSITISGSQVLIDELRLYPVNAQMTTYTYSPLVGMTSECDENNVITYYEYDALGRLAHVRDQDNYILKKYCYNYAGQSAPCTLTYQNTLQTATFIKKDCTDTAYGGSEVVDSVQAGQYYSDQSQEEADSLATDYLNTNGQAFANTNGTCLPRMNFILDNYTNVAGFTVTFTNVYDSTLIYTLVFPQNADSLVSPQKIPQGRYNITITNANTTDSYLFTVSGPAGQIQVNSSQGSWVNVWVNSNEFNRISIGTPQ
jgi:hypothetical protein